VSIGERRKPDPRGQPGFLRIDTVHQGDSAGPGQGAKGVYHINAVDEVTQWQVATATQAISEAYLIPALEALLLQFPFRILGFHSDNGSEYINRTVAKLLGKLHIEQTKSRPRQSGDNGLVETKNGAVIRKHIGYGHIAQAHAEPIHSFYRDHLNPYLNYHRPCAQPEVEIDPKGANASVTSNTKLRSKPSLRWKTQAAFCATASLSTTSNASKWPKATPTPRAPCNRQKTKLFDRIQSPT